MRNILYLMSLLLCLSACGAAFDEGPGLADVGEHFSEAMRWQDYVGAGSHLDKAVRGEFLDRFQQDEDLRVVESRIFSVELNPETESAKVDYRMEYYRLPSMRVKKWQWTQEWQLQQKKALKSGVWQIVNSPPEVP
jgi:hypothetical protein